MLKKIFVYLILAFTILAIQPRGVPYLISPFARSFERDQIIAQRAISLNSRYSNTFVNEVFRNNILLTLHYLSGDITHAGQINWEEVRKPFAYELVLEPGDVFAFHEDVLPQFQGKSVKTTNANFNASQGFLSDGYLYGDGVCHFASLIYVAAKEAGLETFAPTNHNFAKIPGVPREYGVSIYFNPGNKAANANQNLYIENNLAKRVKIVFQYDNNLLAVTVHKTR